MQKQIKKAGFEFQIIAEITNTVDAIRFFSTNTDYDLVFMDIRLQDGYCFKILDAITIEKPIVFCTTFDNYAIDAFKYNSIDYLVKPVKKEAVKTALEKYQFLKKLQENSSLEHNDELTKSLTPTTYKKRFLIRTRNKLKLIHTNNAVCFYSSEGDTNLIEKNGNTHVVDFTMERLDKVINPSCFFRINRKITINIDYIHCIEDYFNNRLKIKMEKDIPFDLIVSRNRVKDFKIWLKGIY